jgi:hypothetical protein
VKTCGVIGFIQKIIVAMRVSAQFRIIVKRTKSQWRTTPPSAHHLCGQQFLVVRVFGILFQESSEFRDALMQFSEDDVRAVASEKLGLHLLNGSHLIGITDDKLSRLERTLLRIPKGSFSVGNAWQFCRQIALIPFISA